MRYFLPLLCMAGVFTITGCSMTPAPGKPGQQSGGQRPLQQCQAQGAQWAVGKAGTEHNINEARQRAGAYMARVLRPGQATTREFNAERLNLEVDASGRIIKAFCG